MLDLAGTLRLFFTPDDPIELRFLGVERPGRTHAGWIHLADADAVVSKVEALAGISEGTYFTPQALAPAVMSRSRVGHFGNVVKLRDKTTRPQLTHDADVLSRRYLLIDVDPVRPPDFARCSATDDERSAALAVANNARTLLRDEAWSDPLVVDSGNGYHLYFRLPFAMPGGACTERDGIACLLRALAARCDTAGASIDTRVYNPSRIMKLPGTWSRKGPGTPDRPHRRSRIIEVPDDWKP